MFILTGIPIVKAIDAIDHSELYARPISLYLATERLKELFSGVKHVFFVNNSHSCLQGENIREMLEACGVARNLKPIEVSVSPYKFLGMNDLRCGGKQGARTRREESHSKTKHYEGFKKCWCYFPSLVQMLAKRMQAALGGPC